MAKHYVIINENGVIIKGFSTDFEQPNNVDICICEDGGRHFELNGVINPSLFNYYGAPLYKMVDGKVVARTQEEIEAAKVEVVPIQTIEERTRALENAMLELIIGGAL